MALQFEIVNRDQVEHHQAQLQPHHQLTDVDPHRGQMISGVTMKTTMPIATGMVALVVTMILVDGTLTVTHVNALIPMVVVAQPQDPLRLLKPLFQPPMYQLKDVDPLAGPLINGVMMKTTMLSAIMMVELVASMKLMDGILTAQYGTFFYILYTETTYFFNSFIGLRVQRMYTIRMAWR